MKIIDDHWSIGQLKVFFIGAVILLSSHPTWAQRHLVSEARAKCAIVVQEGRGSLYRYSAAELQKYIGELTGVPPNITTPAAIVDVPRDQVLILVGGPEANPLVKKAVTAGLIDFRNLKPEGFLLKTIELEGRPALVIGGNDDAGTLYGAYDWLERQGVVFQISHDIFPNHKESLVLNQLDVRSEPAFRQRGFGIASCYETRSIWSYPDIVKFIDQMAKLKLNYLIWHMFSSEPYLEYSYAGEKKLMGDETAWQGGYTLPANNFGSRKVEDYFIGRGAFQKFGKEYLAPDEWQGVRDQERVFASARDLLQRVIRYAKTRNVKVWIALESLNELDANMARYCRRVGYPLPYAIFHGAYVCPTDPTVYAINELRFKSLIASYPEAEGFIFWMAEHYQACQHPEDEELFERERVNYQDVETLLKQTRPDNMKEPRMVENCIGMVHLIQKIIEVRDRVSPRTKIGVGMWGRAFLLPALDRVLPKDVLLVDNETSGAFTPRGVPIQLFGGMGERDRIFMHVGDDDSGMVGMQFHLRLYYHDRMLEGSLENGVQGITELGDRFRGEEHLAKYMADGAWSPHLTPDQFYHDYARRIFGERAEGPMFQAFMTLEENEGYEGYHDNKPELMSCCGPPLELRMAKRYAEQANPYDGPAPPPWKEFIAAIPHRVELFTAQHEFEERALEQMKIAEAVVAPGARNDLQYLESKTQAYSQMLGAFVEWDQAFDAYDRAFQLDPRSQREEFLRRLDSSMESFEKAQVMARQSTQTWADFVDHVSDLGVLWRLNAYLVTGTDLTAQFVENIDNYHHGKPYLKQVEWERVFSPLPIFARGPAN